MSAEPSFDPNESAPFPIRALPGHRLEMWNALRLALKILDERALVARQLANRALKNDQMWLAINYEQKAFETGRYVALLQEILDQHDLEEVQEVP